MTIIALSDGGYIFGCAKDFGRFSYSAGAMPVKSLAVGVAFEYLTLDWWA